MEIDIEHKDWPDDESWRQKLPEGNSFDVPEGYFDDLSERIISGVHLEEIKQADPLGGFTLPHNYFTELSSNIQSRITIEEAAASEADFTVPANYFEELDSTIQSRVALEEALAGGTEAFTVPQGYFDELSNNIQSRIAVEGLIGDEIFSVPQGYFANLSSNIQSRITLEEAANTSKNAFDVPAGYFDKLQQSVLNQTANQQQEAKVVQMPSKQNAIRKLVSSAAFKYASAACVALVVGIAVYVNDASVPVSHSHTYLHQEISEIPADDIRSYLEVQMGATQTEQKVIADGTQLDDNILRAAVQDYVDAQ